MNRRTFIASIVAGLAGFAAGARDVFARPFSRSAKGRGTPKNRPLFWVVSTAAAVRLRNDPNFVVDEQAEAAGDTKLFRLGHFASIDVYVSIFFAPDQHVCGRRPEPATHNIHAVDIENLLHRT